MIVVIESVLHRNGGISVKMKKFFSVITMLAVLLSLSTTAFADNVSQIIGNGNTVVFIDVPNNHWAKAQIDYFAQKGIIAGYKDGSFRKQMVISLC